jgi:glycosyltransferase involved in cell wall biosynthesis
LSIHKIPNGIDLERYCPRPNSTIRKQFDLPDDSIVLLFGAVRAKEDLRKGYDLLNAALEQLDPTIGGREVRLAIFGTDEMRVVNRHGFVTHELGYVSNQDLIELYGAADAMLVPSREDNLPNTVMEALACGTPCVAFDVGGLSDMIRDRVNGYLASPYDSGDFAYGIEWVTESESRTKKLSNAARRKAEATYNIDDISGQYIDIYETALNG